MSTELTEPAEIERVLKDQRVSSIELSDPAEGDWAVIHLTGGLTLYVDAPTVYVADAEIIEDDDTSPLPDPPAKLADAWARFQRGEHIEPYEGRALDEWRSECAEAAGF